jgi:glyoxylase-like metal-dependent hydrolase (beta-lactamase superfamily II)
MTDNVIAPRLGRRRFLELGGVSAAAGLIGSVPVPAAGAEASCPPAAPVPDNARGPAIPAKGYLVEEIRGGLYWVTDGLYNTIFLETRNGVVVVDAPTQLAQQILAAVDEVTSNPITHVIYSHAHADHIGSADLYPAEAKIIAHAETASNLARFDDSGRPSPDRVLRGPGPWRLEFGPQVIMLHYRGPVHQPGNLFIHAPKHRVLMLVDVIFPGWVPFKDLALAKDVLSFIDAHDDALEFDFDTFVGGHVTRLGTRKDVRDAREYVHDLLASATQALQTVDFFAIVTACGGFDNPWRVLDAYLDAVAKEAAKPVVEKWVETLGGTDVWTVDHAFVMAESLRVDFNLG